MVEEQERSSVVRRQLGRRLRRMRFEAHKRIEDVIYAGVASRTKVWRIEAGRSSVKVGVLALGRLYKVTNAETEELIRLAEAIKGTGYLEDYGEGMLEYLGLDAELEADASAICDYQSEMVHGLLQTADYARAVIQVDPSLSTDVIDQRLAFRLRRQRIFFDRSEPARMNALIPAGALSVQVGSPSVMQAQREHLCALAGRDGVSIHVLPFENGLHPAMRGPFTMLTHAEFAAWLDSAKRGEFDRLA
jgi:hypothetical protein